MTSTVAVKNGNDHLREGNLQEGTFLSSSLEVLVFFELSSVNFADHGQPARKTALVEQRITVVNCRSLSCFKVVQPSVNSVSNGVLLVKHFAVPCRPTWPSET